MQKELKAASKEAKVLSKQQVKEEALLRTTKEKEAKQRADAKAKAAAGKLGIPVLVYVVFMSFFSSSWPSSLVLVLGVGVVVLGIDVGVAAGGIEGVEGEGNQAGRRR